MNIRNHSGTQGIIRFIHELDYVTLNLSSHLKRDCPRLLVSWITMIILLHFPFIKGPVFQEVRAESLTKRSLSNDMLYNGTLRASQTVYFSLNTSMCAPNETMNIEAINLDRFDQSLSSSVSGQSSLMLMVNTLGEDPQPISLGSGLWKWNEGTVADYGSYRLVRLYQFLHLNLSEYNRNTTWIAGLFNDNSWASLAVNYSIKAWCTKTPACPLNCNGVGLCTSKGKCECNPGRGGKGCLAEVETLSDDTEMEGTIVSGAWNYFIYNVTAPNTDLLVEMFRSRGDPILFVKPRDEGYVPGGVPTVFDFNAYADGSSFRERVDYHHVQLAGQGQATVVSIGVFNNDVDFQETAVYRIRVRAVVSGVEPLCLLNCSYPNGDCLLAANGSVCMCNEGFAGSACQGPIVKANLKVPVEGSVAPGEWTFVDFSLQDSSDGTIGVTFQREGGQPVLLVKEAAIPALDYNDYRFTTVETSGVQTSYFSMFSDAQKGQAFYFGIYNSDYAVHTSCAFSLTFSIPVGPGSSLLTSPLMAIILAVVSAVSLCFCLGMFRAVVLYHQSANNENTEQTQSDGQGIDEKVVATFPLTVFTDQLFTCPEDAICSVCLAEYEANESLRELPHCSHLFHVDCIDAWLQKHTTCPVCRTSLLNVKSQPKSSRRAVLPPIAEQENRSAVESVCEQTHSSVNIDDGTALTDNTSNPTAQQCGHTLDPTRFVP